MPPSIKISVIVPVYNVGKYLSACLQSLVAQTLPEIEIIAVNDGSTDDSLSILQAFAKQHPCLRIISQKNQGVAAARKAGIAHACGQAVCFVDSDDAISPNYLEELWRTYEETGAKLIVAPMIRFSAQNTDLAAPLFKRGCLYGAVLPSITLIVDCDPVALAPQAVYFYRERTDSQSRAGGGRFEGLLQGFVEARRYLKEEGVYEEFAPGFEYICRVCLTSFIEKYGLNVREEKVLARAAKETWVPLAIFDGRDKRFRWRQRLFNSCLKYGFSYSRLWRFMHLFYGKGARRLK